MQPITKEALEKLIEEAKAAGKDTSRLEGSLKPNLPASLPEPRLGEMKKAGERWIISTGPAKEEDFHDLSP